ncbi:MAG: 23S rRNA (guanosine(2251)-2'-O)-methyltransferase RlmB [Spirochaetaceae bacterium]|nr:23S rRNA (guanosine(2251)-2'-O)-methyltransferase RlmB [Spirochaetaceae bacterium]
MSEYITGFHGIEESLKKKQFSGKLFISKKNKRIDQIKILVNKAAVSVETLSEAELDRLCPGNKGFALQGKSISKSTEIDLDSFLRTFDKENALVVILDGITDIHNYAAILRSADQFYADLVIVPSRRSASDNTVVSKVSAGANNWVPVATVTNLTRAMKQLNEKGFWIYGAHMEGEDSNKLNLKGLTAIILGSEGTGMSRIVRENCDAFISIPTEGHIDSLNVSVAAGILMYEVRRQQG